MVVPPFIVAARIDHLSYANTLIDSGCNAYGLIDAKYARKHQLRRVPITPRSVYAYDDQPSEKVEAVVKLDVDIGGARSIAWAYEVRQMKDQDVILGLPWMSNNDAIVDARESKLIFRSHGISVPSILPEVEIRQVSAAAFKLLSQNRGRRQEDTRVQVFAASLADIDKALKPKVYSDPHTRLPRQYHEYLDVFDTKRASELPPLRGKGVDHAIELLPDKDGKEPEVPYGPLYSMSRDELLVLRKTLTELLDKGFIRVSNSPAAAPVLFVKKPSGGLRFCVDYRALNNLSKKDRYPLPLINETLERIGKANWFTKLDVIAAFHKIRVAEGDEWKTAFRTRYGLFEWLVTPFGLANAPSTFQKYVNWVLREYLDEFVSAYLDDILIFSTGSLRKHREHVSKVLQRLRESGLQIDIDKCDFEVQSTKYLGFIVEANKGVRMDPAKVQAILDWQTPQSVRGVRAFIGFANFYRRFIKDFSALVAPLVALTKKDAKFEWPAEANITFEKLKKMFISAPVLMQFDADRKTVLEVDSSGYVVGGLLQQYDDEGVLRPCAFFSKKNSPAECNYEIYDKELLAIVKCAREWSSELRSVEKFEIITDHKNLTYFTTTRKLKERQMRWAEELGQYNFTIRYRPGKEGTQPDVLSRREQDMPQDADSRYTHREACLLKPEQLEGFNEIRVLRLGIGVAVAESKVIRNEEEAGEVTQRADGEGEEREVGNEEKEVGSTTGARDKDTNDETDMSLAKQWITVREEDGTLREAIAALREGARRFPPNLGIKASVSECSVDDSGDLRFRERRWVPNSEPLRTRIVQETHDCWEAGHPGREITYALVARQFYWPGMSADIRRFCRNCDKCGSNRIWRERRHGLLKPLPIPDRMWRQVSVDFIEKLPLSEGCTNIMVIVDRLSKGVILEGLGNIGADSVARVFLGEFYRRHGLPDGIVSDRGPAFVSAVWKRVCQLLSIKRHLSTAYHPETDGGTERMNAVVEAYLRTFVDYQQSRWKELLPCAELALCNRDAASTGMSAFFLCHGYHLEPIRLAESVAERPTESPVARGERIVKKLADAQELAQASLASAQELQEHYSNEYRQSAPQYKVGDKVWLDLRNIRTDRPSKKLDARNAKYTVLEPVGSHAYRLDTPPGIHNVFHTWLIRPAADDPLPSQQQLDWQPPAIVGEDAESEYEVESILGERHRGRGRGRQRQVLVKWRGYIRPTWEPASALQDTAAMEDFEGRV